MRKKSGNNNDNKNISLRDYFDGRFDELRTYMDIKFNSIEKSTCLAQDNLNNRLENMNEFRASLSDQTKNFITKVEHEFVIKEINMLREQNAENRGKASQQSVYIAYIIAITGIIIGIIGLIIKVL